MPPVRVLCLYDTPSAHPVAWAYRRRAESLEKHAPADINVVSGSGPEWLQNDIGGFDVVFLIDYASTTSWRRLCTTAGIPLIVSFNRDSRTRHGHWDMVQKYADVVIASNENRYLASGLHPRTVCISNGVDTAVFENRVPISKRPHRCIWAGGNAPNKQKGWDDVLQPAAPILFEMGFECDFRVINDFRDRDVMSTEQMVDWYNDASYWLCPSFSEGAPSMLFESMACGCVPIITNVGNVPEIISHGDNGLIVHRDPKSVIAAVRYAKEHREQLSKGAFETISRWAYGSPGHHAEYFYQLFRRVAILGPQSVTPFSYRDVTAESIFSYSEK